MKKLLVVGTVAFDKIETPLIKTDIILGGAGTYIGLAASQFNIDVGLVSVVGEDFPEAHLNVLKDKKINIDGVEIVKGGKTFFWEGRYHNSMNLRDTIETQLNVLADFQPKVPNAYKNLNILLLGNLHPLTQMSAIEQMEERPKLIILDTMNFWMDCALDDLLRTISKIDIISINDEEARQLSGEYSLVKAANRIKKMGPQYVIIKKGENGALLFGEDAMFFAPAYPLEEVQDPTGAGDCFAGGFAGYLTQQEDITFENIKNAMIYGCNIASFCVEKPGTERMQTLDKDSVKERLKQFKTLSHFNL